MVLVWLIGSWMTITGMLDNDIVQPALGGGLILIILLIGFTVMQHAFAGGALHAGPVQRHGAAGAGRHRLGRHRLGLGRGARPRRHHARTSACSSACRRNSLRRPGPQLAAGAARRRPRHVPHHARRGAGAPARPGLAEFPAARRRRPLPLVLAARAAGDRLGRRGASAASARWSTSPSRRRPRSGCCTTPCTTI